mgnify:FL=1
MIPVWVQYTDYMKHVVQFDLGPSYKYLGRSVNDIIGESFPVSAQLGLGALVFAVNWRRGGRYRQCVEAEHMAGLYHNLRIYLGNFRAYLYHRGTSGILVGLCVAVFSGGAVEGTGLYGVADFDLGGTADGVYCPTYPLHHARRHAAGVH